MTSRRLTTALAALLVPLTLSACGSGRTPETYEERPTVDAAQASVGDLQLRNVRIAAPAAGEAELAVGGEATATLAVVNTGGTADQLTGGSSPDATSVDLLDANGVVVPQVDVPALGAVGATEFSLVLRGLTRAVRPGDYVELTLTFVRGGRSTLRVPVATYRSPGPSPTANPFEQATGEGTPG